MPAPSSLQVPSPALGTVSRLPQTSPTPGDASSPFVRLSREAMALTFDLTSTAFSANIVQQWKPVGGYLRRIRHEIISTGGSYTNTGTLAQKGYGLIGTYLFRDPLGQPIINLDGDGLGFVNSFSGQIMQGFGGRVSDLPSYVGVVTTTGTFTLNFWVPFELNSAGYCSIPSLSAAAQPSLQLTLNASASVYQTTTVTTAAVFEIKAYSEFWTVPVNHSELGPPGLGSSAQWNYGIAAQKPANSTNTFVTVPLVGTFIHTLGFQIRDGAATPVRQNNWPTSDLTLRVDGVPIRYESANNRLDEMYINTGTAGIAIQGAAASANLTTDGWVAYTFRRSVSQLIGQQDTHDLLLYTTPATLLEVGGTFGATGTSPDAIYCYLGTLFPNQAIPYSHLGA
jgi:hypothetical protein